MLVAESKGAHHDGGKATVKQSGEEQVKLSKIDGLATVKDDGDRPAALSEVVLKHLLHQPVGSDSTASPLEAKLQAVRVQSVSPHQQDASLKHLQDE